MSSLFEPLRIGGMVLSNRFVRAATYDAKLDDDGHMTQEELDLYRPLAAGGAGMILTGYAHVIAEEQPNPKMMGIYDDSFIEDYAKLTELVHGSGDAKIVLQVAYGGPNTSRPVSPVIWAPSGVLNPKSNIVPVPMELEDIEVLEQAFADAARRAKAAGFDGVELHCAHGYLYSLFLSPYFNRRSDAYGGSIENRCRIICETVARMRAEVGEDYPILAKVNCEDFDARGLSREDGLAAFRIIAECGVDGLEVSGGNDCFKEVGAANLGAGRIGVGLQMEESYFAHHALDIAQNVQVPVILTGGNRSRKKLEELLDAGIAAFGFCRPMICEPDLAHKMQADPDYVAKCRFCSGCHIPGHLARCIMVG